MSLTILKPAEAQYIDDLSVMAGRLWQRSLHVTGLTDDPIIISVRLYRRVWSNYRGFLLLWKSELPLEADIVLRSAIEAAICIGANSVLLAEFAHLVRGDMIETLKGQVGLWRSDNDKTNEKAGEALLRDFQSTFAGRSKRFNWKELADAGAQPQLYGFHKGLSMRSSHVTGFSLMRGVVGIDGAGLDEQEELEAMGRKMHLMMLSCAMTSASTIHASMLGDNELYDDAMQLASRLNILSTDWTS